MSLRRLELLHRVVGRLHLRNSVKHVLIDVADLGRRRRRGGRLDGLRADKDGLHVFRNVLTSIDHDPLVNDDRKITRCTNRGNRQLRSLKKRPDDFPLLIVELLLELHGHLLLLGIRSSAPQLSVELRIELRLIGCQLTVPRNEDRQVCQLRLIDVSDIGEVRRDGAAPRPHGERDGAGEKYR